MKPSCHVSWCVERQGITIYTCNKGMCFSIPYPYAGLWALIANGNYTKVRAVEVMSILMTISKQDAEREIENTLETWIQDALITET